MTSIQPSDRTGPLENIPLKRGERSPASRTQDPREAASRQADALALSADSARASAALSNLRQAVRDASSRASTGSIGDAWLDRTTEALRRAAGQSATGGAASAAPRLDGTANPSIFRTRDGTLLLSGANGNIDLAAVTSTLTVDVVGAAGRRTLTFASGTTLTSISLAINSFTSQTGVTATHVPGRGVEIRRAGDDPTGFVSIEVLDSGGQVNGGFGVIRN